MITSIVTVTMIFVYMDYLKHKPPEKTLLDGGVLLVYPLMTEIAYAPDSFYAYYDGRCGEECLVTPIKIQHGTRYVLGMNTYDILNQNYYSIFDIDLDKNPEMLKKYHTVILLHEEYITKNLYNTINNHPNVIYLYPNSMYAEVSIDYSNETISLVRGHGYPDGALNGFGWIHENTNQEAECKIGEWQFKNITNGIQLNCYPENIIVYDKTLQDYITLYIKNSSMNHIPDKPIIKGDIKVNVIGK